MRLGWSLNTYTWVVIITIKYIALIIDVIIQNKKYLEWGKASGTVLKCS